MVHRTDSNTLDAEMEALAERLIATCAGRHSTVALGALTSVVAQTIEASPDRAYAYACADALCRIGEDIKRRMTT